MMSKDDLAKIREERDVMENWRAVSCHVVADLYEACSIRIAGGVKMFIFARKASAPSSITPEFIPRWRSGPGKVFACPGNASLAIF
jgi:hypothetical protein